MKYLLLFAIFFTIFVHAYEEDNTSEIIVPGYVDIVHGIFSAKVHEFGIGVDGVVISVYDLFGDINSSEEEENSLSSKSFDFNASLLLNDQNIAALGLKNVDENITLIQTEDSNESLSEEEESSQAASLVQKLKKRSDNHLIEGIGIDEFFLTRKLLEEGDRSYIRVSFVQQVHSLQEDEFTPKVQARLYLGRSRKRLRLFVESFKDDTARNVNKPTDSDAPAIGVETITKSFLGIKPKYSIGFHGIDPFARARYSYETSFGRWRLEPIQTFTYSLKDEFIELTELYLDTPTSANTLLRFVIDRGSESHVDGMHYDGFIQWFYQPRPYAGLSFNLGFNGQTKYKNSPFDANEDSSLYPDTDSDPLFYKEENRIFNYFYSVRWRENIWRKWLFYDIGPGVNYHEAYDYRPNYNIYFGLDFYFGHV